MKEDFLHYVWQYKLFSTELKTADNEEVIILETGTYNTNTGTDFLNAKLKIDGQIWVGNIEIHLKSSNWYTHNHETDKNYDTVILHVVYENDTEVFMKNNKPLPTLEIKNCIDKNILENYNKNYSEQLKWILCEKQITEIKNNYITQNVLERLYFQRLENKSVLIKELLNKSNNDFEAVLFQLLAKNFGLKVNGETFLSLAESVDFSIVRKEWFNEDILSALMFGQAGFLSENIEGEYFLHLKSEYKYLQHKYKLTPIDNNNFQFFRMRPNNFPTIRIAQLVSLYHIHHNLFSKILSVKDITSFYSLLNIKVNDFWKNHYTFTKESKKSSKKLTKSFIDLLIINTIIPLKYVYEYSRGKFNKDEILNLMKELKPEKNSIISKFSNLKIEAKNAFETQALLELKNEHCNDKNCLHCTVTNKIK
ncbi:MAG: DUF2851 family protein [Tenacibaculum sp.]|nr:DUF2851 family protein [Tenacibaculum sp.]